MKQLNPIFALAALLLAANACEQNPVQDQDNPQAPYYLSVDKSVIEAAGRGIIKIQFQKNVEADARSAKLYVTVQGYKRSLMATFEQPNGKEQDSMGEYLIKKMEERLTTEYLWAEEYSKLEREQVSYDSYLFTNLTKLGSTNIEDGGYYKDNSASAGKRYIYSYIQELNAVTKGPELLATYGLGIGPLFFFCSQQQHRCGRPFCWLCLPWFSGRNCRSQKRRRDLSGERHHPYNRQLQFIYA